MSALDQGTWEVQCLAPWASADFLGFHPLPSRSSSPCAIQTHILSSLSGIFKPVLFGCHPQSRNPIPRADLGAVWERVQLKLGMSGLCGPGLCASVSFLENGNDVVVNSNGNNEGESAYQMLGTVIVCKTALNGGHNH